MNPGIEKLQPYPFEKLAALFGAGTPSTAAVPIDLSIGEPRHATPGFILEALKGALNQAAHYPSTRGMPELRETIAGWLARRFKLPAASIDGEHNVLPVNGTREALFAFAQCLLDTRREAPLVVTANPFYQIYEGAAFLGGADPWYVNSLDQRNFVPDFGSVPESIWKRCQLIYLCTPNNPTGAVLSESVLRELLELADRYDFVIASDECYSEIYLDEAHPPPGLLQVAAADGRTDFNRCIVFHSLSKRSNAPGLRSGFVAGDARLIETFYRYRTYNGGAMPPFIQKASMAAWNDERHVIENRKLYREKFDAVLPILEPVLNVRRPEAGFYLWPETPIPDVEFARRLFLDHGVRILPGSFLGRKKDGVNPGSNRVRVALVASFEECTDAARRIRDTVSGNGEAPA